MINLFVAILFFTIVIAIYVIFRLGHYIGQTDERISNLKQTVAEYKERIQHLEREMEDRKPRAHTHSVVACLEDAIAVLIDAEFTADELVGRLSTARRILGEGRQGPQSYDPDRPAGLRNSKQKGISE